MPGELRKKLLGWRRRRCSLRRSPKRRALRSCLLLRLLGLGLLVRLLLGLLVRLLLGLLLRLGLGLLLRLGLGLLLLGLLLGCCWGCGWGQARPG